MSLAECNGTTDCLGFMITRMVVIMLVFRAVFITAAVTITVSNFFMVVTVHAILTVGMKIARTVIMIVEDKERSDQYLAG